MTKAQIIKLHHIAEYQKKLAWHHANTAKKCPSFKEELEAVAKLASQRCRETRQAIREAIANKQLNEKWLQAGAPQDFWD